MTLDELIARLEGCRSLLGDGSGAVKVLDGNEAWDILPGGVVTDDGAVVIDLTAGE